MSTRRIGSSVEFSLSLPGTGEWGQIATIRYGLHVMSYDIHTLSLIPI